MNPFDPSTTLEQAQRGSNRDLAQFHVYNPNGLFARWSALSNRLIALGRGYAAYGDCGYYYSELTRLANQRRVDGIALQVVLNLIRGTIERGEAFLAEQEA